MIQLVVWEVPHLHKNENSRLDKRRSRFDLGGEPILPDSRLRERACFFLRGNSEFRHPCQHFIFRRESARNILPHKARDVGLDAQLHQGVFGELFVGQAHADVLIQVPRQDQHLVRQVFFVRVDIGFFFRQHVPDGHQ